MKVYALVGSSGTGKSHKAMKVAYENGIDFIIDDGLLIEGARKLAGFSAKREGTKIAAVKRALFFDADHRAGVIKVLKENPHKKVLVLGTSDEMVEKIVENLELPAIEKIYRIEEISSSEEIKIALNMRSTHGKHVVPLPAPEVKKEFSGYFMDSLKTILKKRDNSVEIGEKTVVRPSFSYLGKFTISDKTIAQIVSRVARDTEGIVRTTNCSVIRKNDGIIIDCDIQVVYRMNMIESVKKFQEDVGKMIDYMTMIQVHRVNVGIKSVQH